MTILREAGTLAARRFTARRTIVVGTMVLAAMLALAWPAGRVLIVTSDVETPDAIVSLASHEWERLPATAQLWKRTPSASVLLTEPVALNLYNCHECGRRVELLEQDGVDPARIVVLSQKVTRTYDEALAVRGWAQQNKARRLMVVTSPYHTRRALATFQSVLRGSGIAVGVYPATAFAEARPDGWLWHKYDRHYVAYEWSASLFYLMRFGVGLSYVGR